MTPEQTKLQRVVCAACRKGGVLLIGPRHFDTVMRAQLDAMGRTNLPGAEQGFIDQWGNFLTRREAWNVARRHGQIMRLVGSQNDEQATDEELFSENLY